MMSIGFNWLVVSAKYIEFFNLWIYFNCVVYGHTLQRTDSSGSEYSAATLCYENGNESVCFMKSGKFLSENSSFHDIKCEDDSLLAYCTVQSRRGLPTIHRRAQTLSSGCPLSWPTFQRCVPSLSSGHRNDGCSADV
jgi:hypothetical protein